jgi:hypothetical protein
MSIKSASVKSFRVTIVITLNTCHLMNKGLFDSPRGDIK